jgi:Sulfatase
MSKGWYKLSFYPWLFAPFPALFLYSHNLDEASGRTALLASGLSLALAALVWLMAWALARDGRKAALIAFVFCLMFFTYGHLGSSLDLPTWVLVPWGAAFLVIAALVLLTRRDFLVLIPGLNIFALVLIGSVTVQIAWPRSQASIHDLGMTDLPEDARLAAAKPDTSLLPDIFYLIVDRYANEKVLADSFKFENSEFLGFLRSQGFYIAGDSRCNYLHTSMSLASSLNMDYIDRIRGEKNFGQGYVYRILKDSRVRRLLKSLGYTYFHQGSWWEGTSHNPFADRNLLASGIDRFWSDYFQEFVGMTVLQPVAASLFIRPRKRAKLLKQFDQLQRIPAAKGPRFVFSHILATHAPYVFGPNGEAPRSAAQSKDFTYTDQVRYTNKLLIRTITTLLKNGSRPAVIILQSDEGPKPDERLLRHKRRYRAWQKDIHEPILNAMAFPGADTSVLYPSISPVNTFRVLFNLYFGAHYRLLPDVTRAVSGEDFSDESD